MRGWLCDQIVGKFIVKLVGFLVLLKDRFFCFGVYLDHTNIPYVENAGKTLKDNLYLEVEINSLPK